MTDDEEMVLYVEFLQDVDKRLVIPPKDNAPCVKFDQKDKWRERRIWQGYFWASEILLKAAIKGRERDSLIFPALFNFRHAVEVALKWHIEDTGGVVPKGAGHKLSVLVDAFRKTAEGIPDDVTYISEYVIDCISELDKIDPHSLTFRYAAKLDRSGIDIYPARWDLTRLLFTVDVLSEWFYYLSDQVNNSRDLAHA
ncbi:MULTISPECIES: hypothetical protein [Asticcacaulis]|uniref:hypothetical protein n=1 Tax=Asticcacaulis TaxID=76890 RepID=UPI001AE2D13A|nr:MULTISPECIES: hypothetical protein [Asticcacaulis]MBP2158885.1 hypothetical protein [Asticcacaulis solisilvae]MDR6799930.1 hypothetical protein [Asticcacaulis sp. BE141]